MAFNEVMEHDGWSERGDYWLNFQTEAKQRGRAKRFVHAPLILSGHGVRLKVDRGSLLVRNGFTHYPQELDERRFFPKDRYLPSRIVILDSDGGITFSALAWLAEQGVPLVQINWKGEMVTVGGGFYAADMDVLKVQLAIQDSGANLDFAIRLIDAKLENSIETLRQLFSPSPAAELAIDKIQEKLTLLRQQPPAAISALLGIEGIAAATYFRCWHSQPLRWKGIGQKPIPPEWHRIGARMTTKKGNKFARHPVNAMLKLCLRACLKTKYGYWLWPWASIQRSVLCMLMRLSVQVSFSI